MIVKLKAASPLKQAQAASRVQSLGARLGVSAANCRTILHRARMALRACMQRDWLGKKASV